MPLVYYIRRDGLIKIGYTARFADRMRTLRPDALLAVEPGNIPLETGRHHQFAEHRMVGHPDGREWYRPASDLLDHITRMASLYETPDLPSAAAPTPPAPRVPPQHGRRGLRIEDCTLTLRDLVEFTSMTEDDVAALNDDQLAAYGREARVIERYWTGAGTAELARRGWSWRRIGKALGVNYTTAYGWVRDAGLLPSIEETLRARGESVDLDREEVDD